MKLNNIKKQSNENTVKVMWNNDERSRYLLFIGKWKEIFTQKVIDPEIYVSMQKFIGSQNKSAYDCYAFHDRMKQKYKSYEKIVQNLAQVCNIKIDDIMNEREKVRKIQKYSLDKIIQQDKSSELKNFQMVQQDPNSQIYWNQTQIKSKKHQIPQNNMILKLNAKDKIIFHF